MPTATATTTDAEAYQCWISKQAITVAHMPGKHVKPPTDSAEEANLGYLVLQSGQVGFVDLDVFEGEPELNSGYFAPENVVLLPHLGSATVATRDAMGFLAPDGIAAVLAGHTPGNLATSW
jgi:hypothetical protein